MSRTIKQEIIETSTIEAKHIETRYEYQFFNAGGDIENKIDFLKWINDLGSSGWVICDSHSTKYDYLFVRMVSHRGEVIRRESDLL